MTLFLVFVSAVISGTLLWLLWDFIFVIVPKAANYVNTQPKWFDVVAFSWIVSIFLSIGRNEK